MDTISFIGSGNVATHLAKAFFARGHRIINVFSPTLAHARRLASAVEALPVNDWKELSAADIYIIAVEDNAIATVAKNMPKSSSLVLHTAGAVAMDVLSCFENYGVLYPLQAFRREHAADPASAPFFVEANIQKNLDIVHRLALSLSKNVREADSAARARLHLAAVFAGNFVNALLAEAAGIAGDDFGVLQPLVRDTVERAFAAGHPREAQTGPARRGDTNTMEKHLQLLEGQPELQEVYRLLSGLIGTRLTIEN